MSADIKDVFVTMWLEALDRGWFNVTGSRVHPQGVEHGIMTIIARNNVPGLGLVITVHEEGRKYWSSRGNQGYASASVQTWLVAYDPERENYRYVRLTDTELPRNAQERNHASVAHISYLESQRAGEQ